MVILYSQSCLNCEIKICKICIMKGFFAWLYDFNRRERFGMAFLVIIIAALLGVRFLYPLIKSKSEEHEFNRIDKVLAHKLEKVVYEQRKSEKQKYYQEKYSSERKTNFSSSKNGFKRKKSFSKKKTKNDRFREIMNSELFYFDPNTIDSAMLRKLGVSEFSTKSLLKYRIGGGRFKDAQKLKTIYKLSTEKYMQLLPYVKIETNNKSNFKNSSHNEKISSIDSSYKSNNSNSKKYTKIPYKQSKKYQEYLKNYKMLKMDLNHCNKDSLMLLRGVGNGLSYYILQYREKLGGFYSINQLSEVKYISDSLLTAIRPHLFISESIDKIKINEASLDKLGKHPYIDWPDAKLILRYRDNHGDFKDIRSLFKIGAFDTSFINRIEPYISYE